MKQLENNHKYNLFYGLQDGQLRHISEVSNGIKCKCTCPACDKKLVARNGGKKRIHHFAHYESAECKYGVQTSIHIVAKQILEKCRQIKVPSVSVFINTEIEKTENDEFISHGEFYSIFSEQYVKFDSVILEKKLHRYIPDVVIISKNKKLIIEIAVTHFVGRQKLEKIISSKISAIEIDLSKIENDFNLNDIEPLIIDNLQNKNWLHNQSAVDKASIKQIEIKNKIDEKNLKEWKKREVREKLEKLEKREKWYKSYYKPVVNRKVSDGYTVQQIENCPLRKREFNGQFYANVRADCDKCEHSRRLRDEEKYLICLFDYHNNKTRKKNSP